MYTRQEILKLLNPDPPWAGFDRFIYKKRECSFKDSITQIYTCWRWSWGFNRPTFIEIAKMLKNKQVSYPNDTIRTKIENFLSNISNSHNNSIIKVPTFLHKDLKKVWPAEYPKNTSVPDDAYVAEDVNHRLTAYALKFLESPAIGDITVEIYLGHL